jgi:hypothetical protein
LSKKYELIKLKISKPIENYIYVLVPYYEIKIEESEINE